MVRPHAHANGLGSNRRLSAVFVIHVRAAVPTWDLQSFLFSSFSMSGKSSTGHSNHVSSRVSRFKARVSSIFSPSSPNPNSRLSGDDRARLAVPAYLAEDQLPPVSPTIPPPIPSFYADHLKAPDHQNYSSTHLAPSSPLQLPRERLSVSTTFKCLKYSLTKLIAAFTIPEFRHAGSGS